MSAGADQRDARHHIAVSGGEHRPATPVARVQRLETPRLEVMQQSTSRIWSSLVNVTATVCGTPTDRADCSATICAPRPGLHRPPAPRRRIRINRSAPLLPTHLTESRRRGGALLVTAAQ
jgi:hypothetical protein